MSIFKEIIGQDPDCAGAQPVGNILAEGKTKIIRETSLPSYVLVHSKDDITAGDGVRRAILKDKGHYSTRTNANCMRLLESRGVPTAFANECSENEFLAQNAEMIPLECVARRIATGSVLKRNPEFVEGQRFDDLVMEFFHKDDPNNDPMVVFAGDHWDKYRASVPKEQGHLEVLPADWLNLSPEDIQTMQELTKQVFKILEEAWGVQNVTLVDLKIEFGRNTQGKLIVADVIDNDSWRIWPGGDKARMLDKQVFRNAGDPTPEKLEEIRTNYRRVMEMTNAFAQR